MKAIYLESVSSYIAIMRAFVKMRKYAMNYKELAEKLLDHDKQLDDVNEVLNYLMSEKKLEIEQQERPRIGFKI